MSIRVHNLTKWKRILDGQSLSFVNEKPRVVVLEVNSPDEVRYFVRQGYEDLERDPERVADRLAGRDVPEIETEQFVGVAKGRARLEFAVVGAFQLLIDGGEAFVYSADGVDSVLRVEAPEIYTRIADRRQRNPHLEMIEYQQKLNFQRFQEQLRAESEARIAVLEQRLASYTPQRDQRAPGRKVGREEGWDEVSDAPGEHDEPELDLVEAKAAKRKHKKSRDDDEGSGP